MHSQPLFHQDSIKIEQLFIILKFWPRHGLIRSTFNNGNASSTSMGIFFRGAIANFSRGVKNIFPGRGQKVVKYHVFHSKLRR